MNLKVDFDGTGKMSFRTRWLLLFPPKIFPTTTEYPLATPKGSPKKYLRGIPSAGPPKPKDPQESP